MALLSSYSVLNTAKSWRSIETETTGRPTTSTKRCLKVSVMLDRAKSHEGRAQFVKSLEIDILLVEGGQQTPRRVLVPRGEGDPCRHVPSPDLPGRR